MDSILERIGKAQNPMAALDQLVGRYTPNPITQMPASVKFAGASLPGVEETAPYTNARSFGGR
jgi:hypothetical protein